MAAFTPVEAAITLGITCRSNFESEIGISNPFSCCTATNFSVKIIRKTLNGHFRKGKKHDKKDNWYGDLESKVLSSF